MVYPQPGPCHVGIRMITAFSIGLRRTWAIGGRDWSLSSRDRAGDLATIDLDTHCIDRHDKTAQSISDSSQLIRSIAMNSIRVIEPFTRKGPAQPSPARYTYLHTRTAKRPPPRLGQQRTASNGSGPSAAHRQTPHCQAAGRAAGNAADETASRGRNTPCRFDGNVCCSRLDWSTRAAVSSSACVTEVLARHCSLCIYRRASAHESASVDLAILSFLPAHFFSFTLLARVYVHSSSFIHSLTHHSFISHITTVVYRTHHSPPCCCSSPSQPPS